MVDGPHIARRAAEWAGHRLDDQQVRALAQYVDWLLQEAIPAGGLGPREAPRVWSRHIADSLTFSAAWPDEAPPPEILDVGSGVGLPGIPLAILWPDTFVTLLDRGGRRIRLLRRIVRILGIGNVAIAQGDVFAVADEWRGIVYRGAVRAAEAVGLTARLLEPGGTAVLGLSRRSDLPREANDLVNLAAALGLDADILGIPVEILDGAAWLLMMRLGE